MKIQSIAHSYWRLIKAGRKEFESLSDESKGGHPSMKEQVLFLAKTDVENGVITAGEYEAYTGAVYEMAEMQGCSE